MNIKVSGYGGTQIAPIESELFDKRIIFLEGEVTQVLADDIAKQIIYLSAKDSKTPISLIINSPGGDVDAGLKICDAVSGAACTVNAYCFGWAYSMGAIIFEAVNGKRYMIGHSKLMLHQPSVTALQHQTTNDIAALADQMDKKNSLLLSIVSKKSGISQKTLSAETQSDRYYDADEAVRKNLADAQADISDLL